jgi:2-polyprenyl-3-methyl-5-hydroxy-6-metoxy-1,4-benzoquinol methylase
VATDLSDLLARFANAWKRALSSVLPYQPMPGGSEVLDREYSGGEWDYLRELDELSRFSVIAGYCHCLKPHGSILEIGCGEGILQERLDAAKHSRFIGVDISAAAISRAAHKQNERTTFVAADASSYCPDEAFDVIIFNECLEYFTDPVGLVRRYERFLKPGGTFIVSMFVGLDTTRTARIWRMLMPVYRVAAGTSVTNHRGYTWVIKVLSPAKDPDR